MSCLKGQNEDSKETYLFSLLGKSVFKNVRNTETQNAVWRESASPPIGCKRPGSWLHTGISISQEAIPQTDVLSTCGQDSPPPQTFQKHTPKPALARSQGNSIIHPDNWEGKAGSEISSGWTFQVYHLASSRHELWGTGVPTGLARALRMPWSSLQDWCSPGTKHLPKRINFLNSCMVAGTKSSTVFLICFLKKKNIILHLCWVFISLAQ